MNILSINPKVLPSKIILIELKSKIYIFIHPFKILFGLSKNLLEANSTLTQVSFLLTFQLRNTDKVVPTSITNNSLLLKFKATKIPKKKDDKKFTIEVF